MQYVPRAELENHIGVVAPPSDWITVDQARIDAFAEATEDRQFIHIDPEQAAAGPFGVTIAHGFLSLSLISYLATFSMVVPEGTAMVINYGSDKVRFLAPVKVDSRVRALTEMMTVTEKGPNQLLVKCKVTIEIEGESKPALIAEILSLFVTG